MSGQGVAEGRGVAAGAVRPVAADEPLAMAALAVLAEAVLVASWLAVWPTEARDLSVVVWLVLLFVLPAAALALSVAAMRGWRRGPARTAAAAVGGLTGLVAWTWVALAVAYVVGSC